MSIIRSIGVFIFTYSNLKGDKCGLTGQYSKKYLSEQIPIGIWHSDPQLTIESTFYIHRLLHVATGTTWHKFLVIDLNTFSRHWKFVMAISKCYQSRNVTVVDSDDCSKNMIFLQY